MRITISDMRTDEVLLTFVDGSHLNTFPIHGLVVALEKNGLDGWLDSTDPKYDDPGEIPSLDGAFWPEEILLQSRILTIRGFVANLGTPGSTVAVAAVRDVLSALVGRPLVILIHDESGPRETTGYLSSKVTNGRVSDNAYRFSLIVSCPDPLKYGSPAHYVAGSGSVLVENAGTGDVPFVVSTYEQVSQVAIGFAGRRVEWQGNADGLVLDMADGVPRDSQGVETGVLVWADHLRIPPGAHEITVMSDAPLTLTLRPGWK